MRHRPHWAQETTKTKGQSRLYNPETQAILGTRNNKDKGTIKIIQSRDTGHIGHKKQQRQRDNQDYTIQRHRPYWAQETTKIKGQSRLYNPETQATLGTRNNKDKGTIKIIQSRDTGHIGHKKQQRQRDNQDYTIQRHRPHWAQETEQRQRDNQEYTIMRHRPDWAQETEQRQRNNQDYTIMRHRPHWAQETEQRQRDNQEYTIQRHRPHWAQ